MFVCVCNAVTDKEVRAAIDGGARSREEVTAVCGAGGDCGSCHHMIEQLVEDAVEAPAAAGASSGVDLPAAETTGPMPLVAAASLVRNRAA